MYKICWYIGKNSSPTAVQRMLFTNNFDYVHVVFTNIRYNKITGKTGIKQKGNDIMAKFKVGDHVVSHCDSYSITKTGWTGIVTELDPVRNVMSVRGDNRMGGCSYFNVDVCDFDLVCDQFKVVITTDGKTTTATHYDGKRVICKETARCNPDDTFDFLTGAKIAFDRLAGKEKKRNLRELMTPGTFGKTKRYDYFVVVGTTMVFKDGGWMSIDDYSMDTLESPHGDRIEWLVKPGVSSFNVAALEYDAKKNVVWERK